LNKIAASAAQLANCILLHAYSHTNAAPSCASTSKKLYVAYLTSWHNSIFGYKLRTASLYSEFTGSYKKLYFFICIVAQLLNSSYKM